MNRLFFFSLLFLFFLPSLKAEEELVVRLDAKEERAPLHISFFSVKPCAFDDAYLRKLEGVLKFDLDHNGKTFVVDGTKQLSSLAAKEKDLYFYDREKWNQLGLEYVVKAKAEANKLSLSVFTVKDKKLKVLEGLSLSGNLSEDRKVLHQLSDAVHLALFGEKGIASTKILYTVRQRMGDDATKWTAEVWQADYDGANAKQVTREGVLCVTPTYIPSASGTLPREFLYVSYKVGQPKIFRGSLDSGAVQRLTYLRGNQFMPVISPTKDKIAFIADISGNPDVFIQDFSLDRGLIGKPRQIFAAPKATQGSPTFSPDGSKLAFVSNKDGTARIYILDIPPPGAALSDLKPLLISKMNRDNTGPAWSPDGKKIAYSAMTKGVRQIWIYDTLTKKETQLTEGDGHKENPAWAPNSLHLVFNSSSPTCSELHLINLNQKKAVKISSGPGEKRFPAWEPYSKEERKL